MVPNGGRSVAHVNDWRGRTAYHNGKKVQVDLAQAVKMWPTPTARATADCPAERRRNSPSLSSMAAMYPTPTARDYRSGSKAHWERRQGTRNLNDKIALEGNGGQLNPTWVEWLMGFPAGWTVLGASEMPSSRKSRKSSAKP
jgi:hypothetical protein